MFLRSSVVTEIKRFQFFEGVRLNLSNFFKLLLLFIYSFVSCFLGIAFSLSSKQGRNIKIFLLVQIYLESILSLALCLPFTKHKVVSEGFLNENPLINGKH